MKQLCAALLGLLLCGAVSAAPMRALDDEELSEVTGGAIGIAAHLDLDVGRIAWGFNGVDNIKTYLVLDKVDGIIDIFALAIDLKTRPGGSDYFAISLPGVMRFTKFSIDSISAQSDPLAPITSGNLGRFEIDGQLSFTGQIHIWPH
jgi:hypothetical protein